MHTERGNIVPMKDRIYVCHTYYHVYVTFLKELKLRAQYCEKGESAGGGASVKGESVSEAWKPGATLVLSEMSNNFENLKARVESTGLFEAVIEFDEKREDFFPELAKYRKDTGNFPVWQSQAFVPGRWPYHCSRRNRSRCSA